MPPIPISPMRHPLESSHSRPGHVASSPCHSQKRSRVYPPLCALQPDQRPFRCIKSQARAPFKTTSNDVFHCSTFLPEELIFPRRPPSHILKASGDAAQNAHCQRIHPPHPLPRSSSGTHVRALCATTHSASPPSRGQVTNASAVRASMTTSRTMTATSVPPPLASSKLPKRRYPQRPHRHPQLLHPVSHSTSGPQVSASSAAARITPADSKTSHSRQSDREVRIRTPREV